MFSVIPVADKTNGIKSSFPFATVAEFQTPVPDICVVFL
jgi:hypothetical protein